MDIPNLNNDFFDNSEESNNEIETPLEKKMNILLAQIKKCKKVAWDKMEHSFEDLGGSNRTLYSLLLVFNEGGRTLQVYVKGLSGARLWVELETDHLNVTEDYIKESGLNSLVGIKIKYIQK